MTAQEILNLEGVVLRKIPEKSYSLYRYTEHNKSLLKKPNTEVVEHNGEKMIRETQVNPLGGKYLLTVQKDQMSTVRFNKAYSGIGETVEEAYQDFLEKQK